MPGDNDLLDDNNPNNDRHDWMGREIHVAPDGSTLTEKTGWFGETVLESSDGTILTEETDAAGLRVLTDSDNRVVVTERQDVFENDTLTFDSTGVTLTEIESPVGVTYSGDGSQIDLSAGQTPGSEGSSGTSTGGLPKASNTVIVGCVALILLLCTCCCLPWGLSMILSAIYQQFPH